MDNIPEINKVDIRPLHRNDYKQLAQSFTRTYSDGSDVFWSRKQIDTLITIFPEGQVVTVVDKKIVGCALSIIVDYDLVKNDHSYASVTGNESFDTHNPQRQHPVRHRGVHSPPIQGATPCPTDVRLPQRALRNS